MHPCTENPPTAGRARTPMFVSASCPAFHMRDMGGCPPGNSPAGPAPCTGDLQRAGRESCVR
ncbi:hypothetical protein IEO21_09850 [Rhodonia placenta]|uniref:Uncharacterized protein n=1 Tax=Rhodonia placenta TaxID=104341 RepID=A0A8H7NTJ7_9APHY|nr:hypothetical protein IEO21_09850 [Postia placenta]